MTAEYIIQNARLDEDQAGIRIAQRNINNLRYADDTTPIAKTKRNSRVQMRMKKKSENWTARLNQSIIREINLEYSLEGLMLKH